MLRINQNSHASGAKSYYSSSDYYVDGQELTGVWRGEGARLLGLTGDIQRADWDALCDQLHPQTGAKLLQRRKDNRTVGYDLNFHVPKSVSVLYAATKDERLVDAFRASVDSTMRDIEGEMQTRVRKGGQNEDRRTSNMVWGEFVHFTSRPIDGIPDPHLHAHCFAFNTTFDREEERWKAGQFRNIKRDAPYFEAMFHSRLSSRLSALGLPIERTKKSWEIAGVPTSLVQKFSRRTQQIEEKAREKGINDPEAKAELGAKTRSRKAKDLTMPQLQTEWRSRMSPQELDALGRLEKLVGTTSQPQDDGAAARAVEYAIGHEFERRSVVPERQLLATALKHAVGQAGPDEVLRQAERGRLIVSDRSGRRMATTAEVLTEEQRVVDFARNGRGTLPALGKANYKLKRDWLDTSQRKAVEHILQSHDRVVLVRGAAGTGKTSLMQEAVEAIEAAGTKVVPLAPTANASRGVLRDEGFKTADTLARFLKDERLQVQAKGAVLWADEAGLVGIKTMNEVLALAEKLDARLLLTGDRGQHHSVERGSMLRLLEEEAGLTPANLKDIRRQTGEYKAAVEALRDGNINEGFTRLDRLGWIRELPEGERYQQLATDYVESVTAGKKVLVVSPTHNEGDRITAEIRSQLKERGVIGQEERTFAVLKNANLTAAQRGDLLNYQPGDVLQFHQNAKGHVRGQRLIVSSEPLPLDQAQRFSVYHSAVLKLAVGDMIRITQNGCTADKQHELHNGSRYQIKAFDKRGNIVLDNGWVVAKDFRHLAYGFVVTSHSSQGQTVDRVLVGQGSQSLPASSLEQFYVSCSRARERVTIYCDNKESLLEAVGFSDERMSALELMKDLRRRDLIEAVFDRGGDISQLKREGRAHERSL